MIDSTKFRPQQLPQTASFFHSQKRSRLCTLVTLMAIGIIVGVLGVVFRNDVSQFFSINGWLHTKVLQPLLNAPLWVPILVGSAILGLTVLGAVVLYRSCKQPSKILKAQLQPPKEEEKPIEDPTPPFTGPKPPNETLDRVGKLPDKHYWVEQKDEDNWFVFQGKPTQTVCLHLPTQLAVDELIKKLREDGYHDFKIGDMQPSENDPVETASLQKLQSDQKLNERSGFYSIQPCKNYIALFIKDLKGKFDIKRFRDDAHLQLFIEEYFLNDSTWSNYFDVKVLKEGEILAENHLNQQQLLLFRTTTLDEKQYFVIENEAEKTLIYFICYSKGEELAMRRVKKSDLSFFAPSFENWKTYRNIKDRNQDLKTYLQKALPPNHYWIETENVQGYEKSTVYYNKNQEVTIITYNSEELAKKFVNTLRDEQQHFFADFKNGEMDVELDVKELTTLNTIQVPLKKHFQMTPCYWIQPLKGYFAVFIKDEKDHIITKRVKDEDHLWRFLPNHLGESFKNFKDASYIVKEGHFGEEAATPEEERALRKYLQGNQILLNHYTSQLKFKGYSAFWINNKGKLEIRRILDDFREFYSPRIPFQI